MQRDSTYSYPEELVQQRDVPSEVPQIEDSPDLALRKKLKAQYTVMKELGFLDEKFDVSNLPTDYNPDLETAWMLWTQSRDVNKDTSNAAIFAEYYERGINGMNRDEMLGKMVHKNKLVN